MTTKFGKSCNSKRASGNGESGAATTPSDDDERLNLSESLSDANPRPLIQLANLAPQLRASSPNTTLDSGEDLEAPPFDRPCQGLMDVEGPAPSTSPQKEEGEKSLFKQHAISATMRKSSLVSTYLSSFTKWRLSISGRIVQNGDGRLNLF